MNTTTALKIMIYLKIDDCARRKIIAHLIEKSILVCINVSWYNTLFRLNDVMSKSHCKSFRGFSDIFRNIEGLYKIVLSFFHS